MSMSSKFESMTGKVDYAFPEYNNFPHYPIQLGQKWYLDALEQKVNEPRAMVLVTANASRKMSSRVMAIIDFTDAGIIFSTHDCSQKIKDTQESPFACGHFYWRELGRQLSVSGKIIKLERERAVAEWNKRPIPLHSMSTASHQSEPLISYESLLAEAEKLNAHGALPCPERYGVYMLQPETIQFWAASSNRLHRRLSCTRTTTGWEYQRLQP
jgi:pyridoxine/pyridoxamine 5'-phosphate oxidase